jgi:hypothetical protein
MAPNHTRSLLPRHYIATILAMLLFALASCQRREQQIQTPTVEANLPASTSPDEASTAIPADFDRGMPLFPGATVAVVRKPKGSMREILMATGGSVDQVIDFYRSGLEKNGFAITSTLKVEARKTWSCDFHKGDRQASVLLYPSDADKSRTTIDLMYEMPASSNERPTPPDEKFDVVGPGEVAQQTQDQNEKRSSGWHY